MENSNLKDKKSLKEIIREKKRTSDKHQKHLSEIPILDDPYKKTNDFKDIFRKDTAYGFVPSKNHYCPWDEYHPECPSRATVVNETLKVLFPRMKHITENDLVNINTSDLLGLVHSEHHIRNVLKLCEQGNEEDAQKYDSIYFHCEESYCNAIDAAKMTLSMAKFIAEGMYQNGFANVRPPGHHATPDIPNGYCFFNNVAIAGQYLLNENLADRILIIDYDVHHGQGTQRIFYETNKVLYFSIHRYEHGTFWPNLEESSFEFIGEGNGKGYNVNVPLNETGLTDFDYLSIIINVLLPIAYEYNPSIVLVSAGYDACIGCPEGCMNVTPAFYHHLIILLNGLASGKILVVLEGGYYLPSLGEAALKTVQALLNDSSPPLEVHRSVNASVIDSINNVKVALRPHWKCFRQIDPIEPVDNIIRYDRYNNHVAVKKYIGKPDTPPFLTRNAYTLNTQKLDTMHHAKLQFLKAEYDLRKSVVGFFINEDSLLHNPPADQRTQEVHARLTETIAKLKEFKLLDAMKPIKLKRNLQEQNDGYPLIWMEVEEIILKAHSQGYIRQLARSAIEQKPDLYITDHSKIVCQYSCAYLCQLVAEVIRGRITHGVGLVRPPGHHAKRDHGGGFCLINNVVVAALYAIGMPTIKRVLILDFDVHHGDGTQQLTYEYRDIMYISMHRFDEGNFFPKDSTGNFTYVGEDAAAGYNWNIAFDCAKMGDAEYLYTWIKLVLPVSYAFDPDLILISAGFDAGINDPLGRYNVHPEAFGHFVQLIKPIAPVVLAMEGGYNLETTSLGMVNCVKALLGDPLPRVVLEDVKKEAAQAIMNSASVMKLYWPILEINKILDPKIRSQRDLDRAMQVTQKLHLSL